ncbi:MAG: hypothetical protein JRG91_19230 [Deltaproteobacteria bacterium]|nr:hypothetical protein [Deltaproteobacteria bacterium]
MTGPLPGGTPLAIGSLPHVNAAEALDVILDRMQGSPHWPQLPRRSFLEQMEHQFSACIPGVVIDEVSRRLVVEVHAEGFHSALEHFYEQVLLVEAGGAPDHFKVTEAYAPGFFAFEERLAGKSRPPVVKGQCTGPFTLGLRLMTTDDRAILFDDNLADVVYKAVANHARWQARRLARLGERVIVSVDEPVLASFGSTAMITVTREQVVSGLSESVEAIHAEGALASAHCCGNTDWLLLVDAGMDVLFFDAYGFADKMAIYAPAIRTLLERGGMLGWGIVPTSEAVRSESVESLMQRLIRAQDDLAASGLDRPLLRERTLITPSCGTGPQPMDDALRVYDLTAGMAARWMRDA